MRKFLSAFLYLFLGLPLALSTLLLVSARPWVLDRETYRRFVDDDRLYAALRSPEIAARAPETIRLGSAVFEGPALVAAAQKELPLSEMKSTASNAVDGMLDALEGGMPGTPAAVDLRPLKAALRAKSAAMARDYLAALSKPAPDQAGPLRPAAVAEALTAAIDAMPDLAEARAPSAPVLGRAAGGPMGVLARTRAGESRGTEALGAEAPGLGGRGLSQALLNRMTATMAAVSALLLAALGALGGRSALSRMSRAGRYLLLPSIVVLGVGVALAIPGGLILQNLLPRGLQDMVGGSAGAQLRAYLAVVLGPIARSFFVSGLVGASIGGVLAGAKRLGETKELE